MVKFNSDTDIPNLAGRVILITGGTDGLGKEAVFQFSKHNPAHIYLAARSKSKAESAIAEIRSRSAAAESSSTCPIAFVELDLSSLESVKAAARTFLAASPRLDILMCNAGLIGTKGRTKDGYETAFGVNHLGHALFIKLLQPILQKTAKELGLPVSPSSKADVRVIVLASDAERLAPKNYYLLKPDEIKSDLGKLGTFARYGHSKIANAHYAWFLARHYPEAEHGVKFVSVHPGGVTTNLGHEIMGGMPALANILRKVAGFFLRLVPVEEGVKNQLWAAVAPDVKEGVFYHPVGEAGKGSERINDEKKAQILWDWTEKELEGHA